MRRNRTPTLLFTALLSCAAGCDHRLSIGGFAARGGDNQGDSGGRGDAGPDGGPGDAGEGCLLRGPLLRVGDGPGPLCAGSQGTRAFRYAACSCDDLQSSTPITVDAFGSASAPSNVSNGSLGINGAFYTVGAAIGGSLVVAGGDGIPMRGDLTIGGDLSVQGQLNGPFEVVVDGNAQVGGDVRVTSLTLGGSLRVSPASTVDVTDGNPAFTAGSVDIAPPCDCEAGPDISALVAAARNDNDNQRVGLDPAESLRSLDAPIELTLPCGRYYVDTLYAPKPITLTITGHVTLYVGEDLATKPGGALRIQLAPGAEFDLVIRNDISAGDLVEIGSPATPGQVRVYAGGSGTLFFAGNTTLSGTLYAPKAELVASATFELYGAMLTRRVSTSGNLRLHYDRNLTVSNCP